MEIVKLTPKAIEKAKELLTEEQAKKPEAAIAGLRIAVIGGGCSGLQYALSFKNKKETDTTHVYENGLAVIVDEKSALYLVGTQLEYHDSIDRCGFEVVNPSASTTCGCGQSFS